jgi:coproporphyrinogen III oxidase-like Fe-S oxidoreductase
MITGLRLTREGIAAADFRKRFGRDLRNQFPKELQELTELGLLEWAERPTFERSALLGRKSEDTQEVIRLTPRGRLLGNRVFMRFVEPKDGHASRPLVPIAR